MAEDRVFRTDRGRLAARLGAVLPSHGLLLDEEELRPYECDGLAACRALPAAVCLPESEAQVRDVLGVCHQLGVPVVARGAGTGLAGGARPQAGGVVLSLARLNRILRLDPAARLAVVQPGVRNQAVSEAAAAHGLRYAPDPASRMVCTLGGNVAENAGGIHAFKYGPTLHNVLGLRAITLEGEILEAGSAALDGPGYDLLALLVGSEGTLAVITEVTVKLIPQPEAVQVVMASFGDVAGAGEAVAAIIAAGIIPAELEMLDRAAMAAAEPLVQAGYDLEAAAVLLCEADGTAAEVAEDVGRICAVLAKSGARRLQVAASEAEGLRFRAGRLAAFPAVGSAGPDCYGVDCTVPGRHLAAMLQAIARLERTYGLRCANVCHAGDGNLHPLVMYDAARPGQGARAEALGAEILELAVALGGDIAGEYGVGVRKINQMCAQYSPAELDAFRRIKAAFDEAGLLNPGKVLPSLECAAGDGRLHRQGGRSKFPDLERF